MSPLQTNRPRIAIPMPHGLDPKYAERAIPQYERAVALAGGEPVRIALNQTAAEIKTIIESCAGVLLPGSKADVDPARFHAPRSPRTAASDPRRDEVDNLLLDDAYLQRKPVLGICYGLQSLNVYRAGSLIQHIPDFLPEATRARINHEAGGKVPVAHSVEIDKNSLLAEILSADGLCDGGTCGDSRPRMSDRAQLGSESEPTGRLPEIRGRHAYDREGYGFSHAKNIHADSRALAPEGQKILLQVNSSHHQSADSIGAGLRVIARCPDDGIIEALEGTAPDHFLLAVQWHPERSVDHDPVSRAIFEAFLEAAEARSRNNARDNIAAPTNPVSSNSK